MKQLVGRIYFSDESGELTEHAERLTCDLAAAAGIDAATIYHSTGVWKGKREHGFVFETIHALEPFSPAGAYHELERNVSANLRAKLGAIAETLRDKFRQEAVLVRVVTESGTFDLV